MVSDQFRQLVSARRAVRRRLRDGWEVLVCKSNRQVWAKLGEDNKIHKDEITPPEGVVLDSILNKHQKVAQ
jgi:hypothetical protein